jgi:undecaprenyl-diphosphatase
MLSKILTTPTRPWLNARCERWLALDLQCALWFHRGSAWPWLVSALAVASRLGNGIVWYTLAASMPFLAGSRGWICTGQMVTVGAANLLIYYHLKRWTGRDRPFVACPDITACARALDRFSFPSGHTLHAVAFSLVLTSHYPPYAPLLWGFAGLVASSRVVLGLHYPTDVVAGAIIGSTTGWLALEFVF